MKSSLSPEKTPRNLGSSQYSKSIKGGRNKAPQGTSVVPSVMGHSQIMQDGAFDTPVVRSPQIDQRSGPLEKQQTENTDQIADLNSPRRVKKQMAQVMENIESLQQQLAHHEFQKISKINTEGLEQSSIGDHTAQYTVEQPQGAVYLVPDIQMVKNYAEGYQNLYKGSPRQNGDFKLPQIIDGASIFNNGPSQTTRRASSLQYQYQENYNTVNSLNANRSGFNYGNALSTNRSILTNQQSALSRIKDGTGSVLDILRDTDREFKQKSRHLKIESETQSKLNKTIRTERLIRLNRSVVDKNDRQNPQNVLADLTQKQKILGIGRNAIAFDLRPKYIEANRPKIEGCKQPVADGKCRTMLRIMGNFRDELYGSSLQYQPDGSVGPAPTKQQDKPRKLSKGPSSIRDYRLASMSTLAREALDLDELRQLQEYGERHNIIEVSATSLMNDTGFTSIKQKLHTYLSPDHLKRKSQTSLTMLATHQTAQPSRKINPLDRSFEGAQGGSEDKNARKTHQEPQFLNKFQTLEPEKSAQLPNIPIPPIPSFNANQSVQQFYFGDKKIDGKIDRMNTTNFFGIAQSAVQGQGRASPLIASKLMKSYFDKIPGDPRGQTLRGTSIGFGQSGALAALNLTSSSNAFARRPRGKKQGGHFEEFQRKMVTFNSPNPIADRKNQKKQKLATIEVRDQTPAANTAVLATEEAEPSQSQSVPQPGTAIQQQTHENTDLNQTIHIKTKSNKIDTRRSQGSQKSIISSKKGGNMAENTRGLKLNASSALQIDEEVSPRLDGGTQLITEEVAAAIGVKPDVKGIDEPSGEPGNEQNHESNEDLQIAPIETNQEQENQSMQENEEQSPSVNTAVFQGTNSRNINTQAQPTNNSKSTINDRKNFNLKDKGGAKSRSKSPESKRTKFAQKKQRPPSITANRLQHLTEKTEDKLGTNRLKQIYILNQAPSQQFKLQNTAVRRESGGTDSNALDTATVGSRESPSKKAIVYKQPKIAVNSNQLQFQVYGQQKPVASMMTWFQGQQQQLRQKKQATAQLRLMQVQSNLKPTSNYPTSQTIDYGSLSGTQTHGQQKRPKIMVPANHSPFEEAQFDTIQTSMRRDESKQQHSPTIPPQLVTPPRNTAEFVEIAQIAQTQSNEYLLKTVGTQRQSPNISPQSNQSSRNFDHVTGQSFRSQEKSPTGHNFPTVFPAPENIQGPFPKKNSLGKWEPSAQTSAQKSNVNIAARSPPRQQLDIENVTEEDLETQNLTTQQQMDSTGNFNYQHHQRSFAPRLFDSSINLNELSDAIRSPKGAAGEPEKVFIINEQEKQRLLTLKNMPPGLRKHLRNHKRQATIQQQLIRRNQMSRIDVVFPWEPRRLSQNQINTNSGHLKSQSLHIQNSQMNSGPIYMLDNQTAQQPPGSQSSTLDGHILVQVQHPINASSRANISMTHHLPQARPIPNGQKYKIDHNIPLNNQNQNAPYIHSKSGQNSRSPVDHWRQPPALQAMSSLAQLMPGQIKEVEISSEGREHRDENISIGDSKTSKHIVQLMDSNKNLSDGLGPQGMDQLKHLQSLQSLGMNNQTSTNNITENLSHPSRQKMRDLQQLPVVNLMRTDANKGRAQFEMAQTQSKVNVVNLDFKLSNGSKDNQEIPQGQNQNSEQRRVSLPKRKSKDFLNDSNSKFQQRENQQQRQQQELKDDDSLRKGTVVVDRDSINSSPSQEPNGGIQKSKFPRNQSLISSMKLDYTLRGKQIEQGLQPIIQHSGQTDELPQDHKTIEQDQIVIPRERIEGQMTDGSVHVITSQVGNPNIKSVAHVRSDTSVTVAKDQSNTNVLEPKKSISVSPIKNPAGDKQNMSQTMPEKWNSAIANEGLESTQQIGLSPSGVVSQSPIKDERGGDASSVTGHDPINPNSRLTVLIEQEDTMQAPFQLSTQIISGEVAGFANSATPALFQQKSPRNIKPLPQLGMTQTVLNKDLLAPESPRGAHRGMPKPKSIKRRNVNKGASNTKKTVFNNQMIRDLQK